MDDLGMVAIGFYLFIHIDYSIREREVVILPPVSLERR